MSLVGLGTHLFTEEDTPLRQRVTTPWNCSREPEEAELLEERASTVAMDSGIGLHRRISAFQRSIANSASRNLQCSHDRIAEGTQQ